MLGRLITVAAALTATAVAVIAPPQPVVAAQKSLIAATATQPFEVAPLYPGGPADRADVLVRYTGPAPATVRLEAALGETSQPPAPLCRAADPPAKFELAVSSSKRSLFQSAFRNLGPDGVTIPGSLRDGRWASGEAHLVQLAVSLEQSADNSYMDCAITAHWAWTAS